MIKADKSSNSCPACFNFNKNISRAAALKVGWFVFRLAGWRQRLRSGIKLFVSALTIVYCWLFFECMVLFVNIVFTSIDGNRGDLICALSAGKNRVALMSFLFYNHCLVFQLLSIPLFSRRVAGFYRNVVEYITIFYKYSCFKRGNLLFGKFQCKTTLWF